MSGDLPSTKISPSLIPGFDPLPRKKSQGDMTREQARFNVNAINEHADRSIQLINELRERNGWKALGYRSWTEFVVEEFGKSRGHIYRLLRAAQIQLEIEGELPAGDTIPERVLRPLAGLDTPKERKDAYEEAKADAPDGKPTGPQVQAAVDKRVEKGRGVLDKVLHRPAAKPSPTPSEATPHYGKLGDLGPDARVIGHNEDDEFERVRDENTSPAVAERPFMRCYRCGLIHILDHPARVVEVVGEENRNADG